MAVETIFVAGTGLMGSGIVQQAAVSGFRVFACDRRPEKVERARLGMEKSLGRLVEKGKLAEADAQLALGRVEFINSDYSKVADSDLIIEAITEDDDLKREFFAEIATLPKETALVVSNTSSIPITRLARYSGRSDRFAGMHFFNPVPLMPLVELIRGVDTTDATAGTVREVAEKMGKRVIDAPDMPGFIVNRMLTMLLSESMQLLREGVRPEDIDAGAKLGLNHPMGPLELADFIGLDTMLSVFEVLHDGLGDPRYAAPPVLRQLVDAGHLGRKTGRGFYQYES